MPSAIVGNLFRRGISHFSQGDSTDMPWWGVLMVVSTLITFTVAFSIVEYTIGRLVATLVMVESPPAVAFQTLPFSETNKNPDDPEIVIIRQIPTTDTIRRTLRHLRDRGGRWAKFRGFAIYTVHGLSVSWIAQFIAALSPVRGLGIERVLAALICAPLSLAWTLIVISKPSTKRWYQRIPSPRLWKKIAAPTAVLAIAEQITILLPTALALAWGINISHDDAKNLSPKDACHLFWKGLAVFSLAVVLAFLIVVPANVTLTRVQASLLDGDEEAIISFDRTFDGKLIPEIDGGSGVIGALDAWKTFRWGARIRLIKLYAKAGAMEVALFAAFIGVMIAQLVLILGSDVQKWKASVQSGN